MNPPLPDPRHDWIGKRHHEAADTLDNAIRLSKWRRKWAEWQRALESVREKFKIRSTR